MHLGWYCSNLFLRRTPESGASHSRIEMFLEGLIIVLHTHQCQSPRTHILREVISYLGELLRVVAGNLSNRFPIHLGRRDMPQHFLQVHRSK